MSGYKVFSIEYKNPFLPDASLATVLAKNAGIAIALFQRVTGYAFNEETLVARNSESAPDIDTILPGDASSSRKLGPVKKRPLPPPTQVPRSPLRDSEYPSIATDAIQRLIESRVWVGPHAVVAGTEEAADAIGFSIDAEIKKLREAAIPDNHFAIPISLLPTLIKVARSVRLNDAEASTDIETFLSMTRTEIKYEVTVSGPVPGVEYLERAINEAGLMPATNHQTQPGTKITFKKMGNKN
jgi:hypothetical protein